MKDLKNGYYKFGNIYFYKVFGPGKNDVLEVLNAKHPQIDTEIKTQHRCCIVNAEPSTKAEFQTNYCQALTKLSDLAAKEVENGN